MKHFQEDTSGIITEEGVVNNFIAITALIDSLVSQDPGAEDCNSGDPDSVCLLLSFNKKDLKMNKISKSC